MSTEPTADPAALWSIRSSKRVVRQNDDLVGAVNVQADVATKALLAANDQADIASQALASGEKPVIVPALESGKRAAEWGLGNEPNSGNAAPWFRLRLRNVGQGPALFPAAMDVHILLTGGRLLIAKTQSNVFAPGDEFTALFEDFIPGTDDVWNLARVFKLAADEPYKNIAVLPVTVRYTDMTGRTFSTQIDCTCYERGRVEFGRIRFD